MRAKMKIDAVEKTSYGETLKMSAVTNGSDEDNTFSEYTPSAMLEMMITNPALHGKFNPGESYYLDFTKAEELKAVV